jgi:hypothetical protein
MTNEPEQMAGTGPGTPLVRAQAMYACKSMVFLRSLYVWVDDVFVDTASTSDPSELSFKRGEFLEILDRSGKWWEARKQDGEKGSELGFSFLFFLSFMADDCFVVCSCAVKLSEIAMTYYNATIHTTYVMTHDNTTQMFRNDFLTSKIPTNSLSLSRASPPSSSPRSSLINFYTIHIYRYLVFNLRIHYHCLFLPSFLLMEVSLDCLSIPSSCYHSSSVKYVYGVHDFFGRPQAPIPPLLELVLILLSLQVTYIYFALCKVVVDLGIPIKRFIELNELWFMGLTLN